jgi:hypothetical protein
VDAPHERAEVTFNAAGQNQALLEDCEAVVVFDPKSFECMVISLGDLERM